MVNQYCGRSALVASASLASPLVNLIDALPRGHVRTYLAWAYHAMRITDDVIDEGFLLLPTNRQYRGRGRMLAALNQWHQFVRAQHRDMLRDSDVSDFKGGHNAAKKKMNFSYPGCLWHQSRRRRRVYRNTALAAHQSKMKRNFVVRSLQTNVLGSNGPVSAKGFQERVLGLDHWWQAFCVAMTIDIKARPLLSMAQWYRYANVSLSPAMIVFSLLWAVDLAHKESKISEQDVSFSLLRMVAIIVYLGHIHRDIFDDITRGWRMVKLPWPLMMRAARSVGTSDRPQRVQMYRDGHAQRRLDVYTVKRQRAHRFLSARVDNLWRLTAQHSHDQRGEISCTKGQGAQQGDGVFSWWWGFDAGKGMKERGEEHALGDFTPMMVEEKRISDESSSNSRRNNCDDSRERFLQQLPGKSRDLMRAMLLAYYPQ